MTRPRTHHTLRCRDRALGLGRRTLVMGVLNVTPDSFADGGRYLDPQAAVAHAWRMAEEGADILDIGGESTRPGSEGVSAEEERSRVLPVLEALERARYPLPVSIDTSKADVARAALETGAVILNDVTALGSDPRLGETAAAFGAGVVLMHMRGTPRTMQQIPASSDILRELDEWAAAAVARARAFGISCERIVLDPGIGFGKSVEQNLIILRNLDRLASTGYPVMVGTSRKSFIGAILNQPADDRIWGTGASVAASIIFGAHIVRVHDVSAMRQVAAITDAIVTERSGE